MATNIKLKSSSLTGKTPTLSDLSLRELAVNTADGKLFLRKGDGSASDKIIDVTAPLQASEPMGHEDRSQSTILFNSTTRVFTIQPASTSFNVWVKGIKYNLTTAQTVTIPNTTGLYYIFFNSDGVLSAGTTIFDWENEAPTAYVYWNATTGTAPFVADERHGITLDWQTHEYLHRTRGAVIANGFSLGNFTTTGTGANDSDAQFDLGNGTFFDEDLEVNIVHSNTPVADTWQQDLQGPARIPVFYLSGDGWVRDPVTDYAVKQGTARVQYNFFNGASWTTLDVPTNTRYTTSWIIATNNINYPVLAIMGQSQSNKLSNQEAISFSDLVLTNFPVVEFRPLWKIIWQTNATYANTPKARIAGVYDIRQLSSVGVGGIAVSDHGLLTGLTDDDHLQYLHTTITRTGVTAEFNTTGKITTTNSIGIGTTNPTAIFETLKEWISSSSDNISFIGTSYNDANRYVLRRANGNISSPTGILSGQELGNFNFRGHDGTEFATDAQANVGAFAEENYTTSSRATRLRFGTTGTGATVLTSKMHLTGAGELLLNTTGNITGTASQTLQVTGGAYISGNVGIGVTNPLVPLQVSDGNIVSSSLITSDYITATAQGTAVGISIVASSSSSAPHRGVFKATRSRGTLENPTAASNNDAVFSLLGAIYDGSTGQATAQIQMDVDGTVGIETAPQRISFWTGLTTQASRAERMRISSSGNVGIGTTNPSYRLHVQGDINYTGILRLNGTQLNTTNVPEGTNLYYTSERATQDALVMAIALG